MVVTFEFPGPSFGLELELVVFMSRFGRTSLRWVLSQTGETLFVAYAGEA